MLYALPPKKVVAIPAKWTWILDTPNLPPNIVEAFKHYGTLEIKGADNNPDITGWAKEVGVQKDYTNDEIPWCGLFVAVIVKRVGDLPVDKPLWARNWLYYGKPVKKPMMGDVLVFKRGAGGHVGFYVAETEDTYAVLGGNQSDSVCITYILKDRLLGARRRLYAEEPAGIRDYVVNDAGKLISTNEA